MPKLMSIQKKKQSAFLKENFPQIRIFHLEPTASLIEIHPNLDFLCHDPENLLKIKSSI